VVIIAPFAKKLMSGKRNPKDYPYWAEVIAGIKEPIVQVGVEGEQQLVDDFRKNLPIAELRKLIQECRTWASCDSFFQHLAWDEGKPGVVLWGVSDPLIFGHPENVNLLRDRKYLAENQFLWWEYTEHMNERFVGPDEVLKHINKE
jgi:ADP-heptose:LPS heptosyltransferase